MARVLAGRGTHVVIAARNLTAAETMCQAATSQPTSLRGAYRSTSSFRELNGARLEASVRAYGGAGQRKVSNKCQRAERGEAGGVSEGVWRRRPEEGVQQMRTIAFSSQLKQQFMWLAQSVKELNGARLEASVRAYGGAGQRKVSNKWRVSYMGKQSSGMLLLWKVGSWTICALLDTISLYCCCIDAEMDAFFLEFGCDRQDLLYVRLVSSL
ncbi:uncharacterized protein [Triticum aestivum]|uniref:uncharacterized protein isoform X5 n=1 Tax=Triticum aestivum TaxID=4565 RepID=UPI001D015E61|nr:uncharacterized protein LOC123190084 isoform X5 [Triticum aestivum]